VSISNVIASDGDAIAGVNSNVSLTNATLMHLVA
jgi:hypothetical protein